MSAHVELGPFEEAPPHLLDLGVLCSRSWKAVMVHGVNEVWEERARGYWQRITQRYGVAFTAPRNVYDEATQTITTFAVPVAVLPGTRYPAVGHA